MLCRLCVTECSDFKDIFKDRGCLQNDVANLITTYFTFRVFKDDEFPTIVCRSCLDNLFNLHTFCVSIENAQQKWQNFIKLEETVHETKNTYSQPDEGIDIDGSIQSIKNEDDESEEEAHPVVESEITNLHRGERSKKSLSEKFDVLIASYTKLFCNECNKPLESFKRLKKHYKEEHKMTGFMICCKKKFFRAADLADHINVHLNPQYFNCLECGKSFSSRYSLNFHLKTNHTNENEDVSNACKCAFCPRKFLSKISLDKHEKTHSNNQSDSENYKCSECGKGYTSEMKLKTHHFNVHTMIYSRMCHLCGKIVRGNKALERHQLQHLGINPKVQCEICGTKLSTKGILKAHMAALHPENSNETHVCNECGKKAPSKRALKYHMNYVHKCERSHKCNLCDKSFKRLQTLKEHMTTHTGDRLYECPHCPKTFKVRSNMHHHRKLKHPKEFEENRRNRTKA